MNAERLRLEEARDGTVPWKKWGPYLSERQRGTVREDYSESGNAWNDFSDDQGPDDAGRRDQDSGLGVAVSSRGWCRRS